MEEEEGRGKILSRIFFCPSSALQVCARYEGSFKYSTEKARGKAAQGGGGGPAGKRQSRVESMAGAECKTRDKNKI